MIVFELWDKREFSEVIWEYLEKGVKGASCASLGRKMSGEVNR